MCGKVAISESSSAHARPPFTNAEVFRALTLFVPDVTAEAAKGEFPEPGDDQFQGHLTTAILLVMCTFSDELAGRVVAYDPELEPQVRQVLSDPEKYLGSLREDQAE